MRHDFPYSGLPHERSWSRAVAETGRDFDPQGTPKFRLPRETRIASAGSCFAERLAERLRERDLNYLVAERGGDALPRDIATRFGYFPLSARYGNIYTSRQLLQLLRRAVGVFEPLEPAWTAPGGFIDPFRPRIQPYPFTTEDELVRDRERHLAAVRSVFTDVELFVFTLGLTEVWTSRMDGAALPACPGRGFGVFDDEKYALVSLRIDEVVEDLESFVRELSTLNRTARIILTVSPVPIAATMLPMHVARASALCKATLVVAAETVAARHPNVDYFASYETVTFARSGPAFLDDGRTISQPYVDRVVERLVHHYLDVDYGSLTTVEEADVYIKPCDEDELLRVIAAETTSSPRHGEVGAGEHPERTPGA